MYYYGQNYPYGTQGYSYPQANNNSGIGGWFAVILVIFILLVILGCGCGGHGFGGCGCGC